MASNSQNAPTLHFSHGIHPCTEDRAISACFCSQHVIFTNNEIFRLLDISETLILHHKQAVPYLSALDRVAGSYAASLKIPATRLAGTIFMVAMSWAESKYALLYHCLIGRERRTFMKGNCPTLGLCEYAQRRVFMCMCVSVRGCDGIIWKQFKWNVLCMLKV